MGHGAPPDSTFFAYNNQKNESEKLKQPKTNILPVLKKRGAGRIQQTSTATRRGSYDSGINLVSKLQMLEQVGEMNHIFIRSQKLNSQGIVDFVKALCKVSMDELRSASDPRVFGLTKIVEVAYGSSDSFLSFTYLI